MLLQQPEVHEGSGFRVERVFFSLYGQAAEMLHEVMFPFLFFERGYGDATEDIIGRDGFAAGEDKGMVFFRPHLFDMQLPEIKIGTAPDDAPGMPVEVGGAYHFIRVGPDMEQGRNAVCAVEPHFFPTAVNDGLENARGRFPKTPGPVVIDVGILVYYQYPLALQPGAIREVHGQAQAGTARSSDDIVVMLQGQRV